MNIPLSSNEASSFNLFQHFISSFAFIHDDWNPSIGMDDWDHYDTNPFLLGAKTCVVNTMEGFGEAYIQYLQYIESLPKTIIVPRKVTTSLCVNLLRDGETLNRLKEIVSIEKLNISSFYSDQSKQFDQIVLALRSESHSPVVSPPSKEFILANDRQEARELFRNANVPFSEGAVCYSLEDIVRFQTRFGHKSQVIIKRSHRDLIHISDQSDISVFDEKLTFPVIVEKRYNFRSSPICHFLAWGERQEHLFTLDQIIKDWHHAGNETPLKLSATTQETIINYTQRILKQVPGFIGVFGVDYIVTDDNQVLAVDLNPRFCSSTYPFFLLYRLGLNPQNTYARYRVCRHYIENLSTIFSDKEFPSFDRHTRKGIILFNPVFDFEKGIVRRFSFLAVGANDKELSEIEMRLTEIIARLGSGVSK